MLVKPDTDEAPHGVAAEFISIRLANALGVPVPLGEVATDNRERTVWVSALVQLDGEAIAPPDPAEVVDASSDIAAGIFVFDVWTLNSDRNEWNLIFHPRVGLWAFDHALGLGQVHETSFSNLGAVVGRELSYHELGRESLDATRLHTWGERVRALSRSAIERPVREARQRGLISAEDRGGITQLLLQRQGNIHRLVGRSVASCGGSPGLADESPSAEGGGSE